MVWIHSYPSVELTLHLWVPQRISYEKVRYSSLRLELRLARSQLDLCIEGAYVAQEPHAITKAQAINAANGRYDAID